MREYIFRVLVIFIFSILQVTIVGYIFSGENSAKPSLTLILTVYFAFNGGIMPGQTTGFLAGFFEDFYPLPNHFGIETLIKTIIGFLVGTLHKRVFSKNYITVFIIMFVATLIHGLLYILTIQVFLESWTTESLLTYFLDVLLLELLYNSFLAPFVFMLLNKFSLKANSKASF